MQNLAEACLAWDRREFSEVDSSRIRSFAEQNFEPKNTICRNKIPPKKNVPMSPDQSTNPFHIFTQIRQFSCTPETVTSDILHVYWGEIDGLTKMDFSDMQFVQNFTPPDFQVKNFTPSILPNFNSFIKKTSQELRMLSRSLSVY